MDGDFERLITHPKFKPMLMDYLGYRLRGAVSASAINTTIAAITAKRLTTADAIDALAAATTAQPTPPAAPPSSGPVKKATLSPPPSSSADVARGRARLRDIEPMLAGLERPPRTYLDLGCGNGAITAAIGARLALAKDAIIGADIPNWAGHEHAAEVAPTITWRAIKEPYGIPAADASIDLMTIFMVLHHVADDLLPTVLTEAHRVISPGGYLLLREHDSPNRMIDALINIEHALFEVVIERLADAETFAKRYYGRYKTRRDWVAALGAAGFELVGDPVASLRGTRPFYALFRRRPAGDEAPELAAVDTPALARTAAALGADPAAARTNADLQKMIVHGRRAPIAA